MYGNGITSLTKKFGKALIYRDGRSCRACKRHVLDKDFSVDHIVPTSKGGATVLANLQIMHKKCNVAKGDADYREFLKPEGTQSGYNAFAIAFEKLGITPNGVLAQSVEHAPQSTTSDHS